MRRFEELMAIVEGGERPQQDITADLARANISRVPYLPGLDGLRAIAVVIVMIYHANSSWLPGGFLGVEVFFVISGYLITLLLIAEQEREYRISLKGFWLRRARRLLPALFVLLTLVTVWTALFKRDALGALRGDVFGGLTYVSNWYQVWVGLGYTADGDFAPLRHLWSLAVEEQFYLVWPLVMIVLLKWRGTRRVAGLARWLLLAAVLVNVAVALAYHPGAIGEPSQTPEAYWSIAGRDINKVDALYLSTISRAGGLLLGAAFAMAWRPLAILRGPLRNAGRAFDVMAALALVCLAWLSWNVHLIGFDGAADSQLFRGGLFVTGIATVALIAAITHQHSQANALLGHRWLLWIGTRSYGLYLYHWPIYQVMRGVAGNKLSVTEFVIAMMLTGVISEASYRWIETPVRRHGFGVLLPRRTQNGSQTTRGQRSAVLVPAVAVASILTVFGVVSLATAENRPNAIAADLAAGEEFTTDLLDLADAEVEQAVPGTVEVPTAEPVAEPVAGGVGGEIPPVLSAPVRTVVEPTQDDPAAPAAAPGPATTAAPAPAVEQAPVAEIVPATEVIAAAETVPAPAEAPAPDVIVPATTLAPPEAEVQGAFQAGVIDDLSEMVTLPIVPTPGFAPLVALGDSVMLGAAEELGEIGFAVDAQKSRSLSGMLPTMQALRDNNVYGSVVVFHLGTNGSMKDAELATAMETLRDVPVVIALTGKADRGWIAANNEKVRALPETYPNVTVLDWERLAAACEGNCFYDDGIHLPPAGQRFYTSLVAQLLGISPVES